MTDELTPEEAARQSAPAIHDLAANFMLDGATYVAAAAAGYDGIAFYFAGRGGVLGDVDADAVSEAFLFFPPESVRAGWESAADVESRAESAQRFATAAHDWAAGHLPDGAVDYARLAELAGTVVDNADGTDAPVFVGWRNLAEPNDVKALALHRLNALRELRAARHMAAIVETDLEPLDAFMVKTPYMAGIFGWPEPESDPDEETRLRWERAEELTNERFGADLTVLDADELVEFCELAAAAMAAAT